MRTDEASDDGVARIAERFVAVRDRNPDLTPPGSGRRSATHSPRRRRRHSVGREAAPAYSAGLWLVLSIDPTPRCGGPRCSRLGAVVPAGHDRQTVAVVSTRLEQVRGDASGHGFP